MKLIGYILAVYLILLSAVPCCAFDNCADDITDFSSGTEQASSQEEEDGECDNCSPFFSCEGCATATIAFEPTSLEIFPIKISSIYTGYVQTPFSEFEYDFWQPPKFG